jgi:hypothetical protein
MAGFEPNLVADIRHCGSCTACCLHLPIPEGLTGDDGKPAGVPCPHAGVLGCRCYERRPAACAEFSCTWLEDVRWPAAWRPDRCGLLCLREEIDDGMTAAAVYEIQPDALQQPPASQILNELQSTSRMVVLINAQKRRRMLGRWRIDAPHALQAPASSLRNTVCKIPFR